MCGASYDSCLLVIKVATKKKTEIEMQYYRCNSVKALSEFLNTGQYLYRKKRKHG